MVVDRNKSTAVDYGIDIASNRVDFAWRRRPAVAFEKKK